MPAPKKNNNAGKWTEERIMNYLAEIEKIAQNRKELFLGQVLIRMGLYKDVWCYWKRKYCGNEDLLYEMELIEQRFECNVFRAALLGDIPAALGILCLKNIYGWSENPKPDTADKDHIVIMREAPAIRMAHRDNEMLYAA